MTDAKSHDDLMRRALELAKKAKGKTFPNPCVGAVVVDAAGKIIGEGFHPEAGLPHAEVYAINSALNKTSDLSSCTLYVTLEPCNHHGRTPPCTDLILKTKIAKVVVGAMDPHSIMAGKSLQLLKAAGVEVVDGVLNEECASLIRGFRTYLEEKRPHVSLKCAVSLDGKVATKSGESKWITSPEARKYAHQLRAENDAILVGIGTVIKDDPRLDARLVDENLVLKKIVLDSRLETPTGSALFKKPGEVILFCEKNYPESRRRELEESGAIVCPVNSAEDGFLDLKEVLLVLSERFRVQDLFVEGGPAVLGSFLKAKLYDKLIYFIAPKIIGEQGRSVFAGFNIEKLADSPEIGHSRVKNFGKDFVIEGVRICSQA